MAAVSRIHVGTSGWHYDSWKGAFYPDGVATQNMLPEYAKTFSTVELNNSFYNMPERSSIEHWLDSTPDNFIFSCKASRYITHMKKLKDPQEGVPRLIEALKPFGKKMGPILFQLPPNWRVNTQRLEEFLDALPDTYRYTFEFRDRSWLCEEVYGLLKAHNAALCFYDYKTFRSPEVITSNFVYVRLHGPNETAYGGSYDGRRLAGYAEKFLNQPKEIKNIYCYFDNDQKACAPADARALIQSVNKQARK